MPTDLNNSLALWLDAADSSTITLNGSAVSQWNDKSSNGRNATQPTAASQPIYSATAYNNQPGLLFNGTSSHLIVDGVAAIINGNDTPVSAMLVSYNNTVSSARAWLGFGNSVNPSPFLYYGQDTPNKLYLSRRDPAGGAVTLGTTSEPAPFYSLNGFVFSGTTADLFKDGVQSINGAFNVASFNSDINRAAIGALRRSGVGSFGSGTLLEIVVINAALSTTDRQKLEGYLAWKWGLVGNLPSDHPYKNSAP